MWPHETWDNCSGGPAYFDLDYVYLTGDIMATRQGLLHIHCPVDSFRSRRREITSTIRYMQVDELRLPANSPACNGASFGDPASPPPAYPNKVYLPLIVREGGASGDGTWQDFSPVAQTAATLSGAPVNQTYTLNFSDGSKFTDGKSYYLCIRVNDGANKSYTVSTAPVIRAPLSPHFGPN